MGEYISAGLSGLNPVTDRAKICEKAEKLFFADKGKQAFGVFSMLADGGYAPAYFYLGQCYEKGVGIAADRKKMTEYYQKSVAGGEVAAAYRLGQICEEAGDYGGALRHYTVCSASENKQRSRALYRMGTLYRDGLGTAADAAKAAGCFRKSAECAGEFLSQARIALSKMGLTTHSRSEFQDATNAMTRGMNAKQMYNKALVAEDGLSSVGVKVSPTIAYAYYKAAAEAGNAKAMLKMAEIMKSKYYPFDDIRQADSYYQKARKQALKDAPADGEACLILGNIYAKGLGVPSDAGEAKHYYMEGALKGDKAAMVQYGLILKGEMEYIEAFKMLKAGMYKDGNLIYIDDRGLYELGHCYEHGLGTTPDREAAMKTYREAVHWGNEDAAVALARLGKTSDKE